MDFGRMYKKLARSDLWCWNETKKTWEKQSYTVMLAESGRWIGRSEAFYNRRVILTPERVDAKYEVCRIGKLTDEYLLFASQPNTVRNDTYMFDYTGLNVEAQYADLIELQTTTALSGAETGTQEVVRGSYPVAMERYTQAQSSVVSNVHYSQIHCYIPKYSGAVRENILKLGGESYEIKESVVELNLLHLVLSKR